LQETQDDGVVVAIRNTGPAACLLTGTLRVVASAPGRATVVATSEPMPSYGEITDTALKIMCR
jgi:hypothetical protein